MKKEIITIISDTGPILSLVKINQLEVLNSLFQKIFIPEAVWQELIQTDDIKEKEKLEFFFKSKVKKITHINNIIPITDQGELEAIRLYQETGADLLLIDDKRSKKVAQELKIKCIGTLGILYEAKEQGIIKELKPIFLKLLDKGRYYSKTVLNLFLKEANEDLIK